MRWREQDERLWLQHAGKWWKEANLSAWRFHADLFHRCNGCAIRDVFAVVHTIDVTGDSHLCPTLACPHACGRLFRVERVFERDCVVCLDTGMVHLCGRYCNRLQRNGDSEYVCSTTGRVLERQHGVNWAERAIERTVPVRLGRNAPYLHYNVLYDSIGDADLHVKMLREFCKIPSEQWPPLPQIVDYRSALVKFSFVILRVFQRQCYEKRLRRAYVETTNGVRNMRSWARSQGEVVGMVDAVARAVPTVTTYTFLPSFENRLKIVMKLTNAALALWFIVNSWTTVVVGQEWFGLVALHILGTGVHTNEVRGLPMRVTIIPSDEMIAALPVTEALMHYDRLQNAVHRIQQDLEVRVGRFGENAAQFNPYILRAERDVPNEFWFGINRWRKSESSGLEIVPIKPHN